MFCKSCGKEVKDEAVICPYCGCALAKIAVNGEAEKPEEKRKINVLCLVGFILSAVSWLLYLLLNGIDRVVYFSIGIYYLFLSIIGIIGIVGLIMSIIGVVQANRKKERLRSLGVAGISAAACMLINIIDYLSYLFL